VRYLLPPDLCRAGQVPRGRSMRAWTSQIVIGIIVTVVGTVIANAIIGGSGGRHIFGGSHFSGPLRSGR